MKAFLNIIFSLNIGLFGAIAYTFIRGRIVQHDNGWDGIADALGNFAIGFFVGTIIGYLIARSLSVHALKIATIVPSILSLGIIGFTYFKIKNETNQALEEEINRQNLMKPTTTVEKGLALPSEGIGKVKIGGNRIIYVLSPESEEGNISFDIQDSIVFDKSWA